MDSGTLVLLHSPLVGVESWGRLAVAVRRGGMGAVAPAVDTDDRAPFGERHVRGAVAGVVGAGRLADPVVLVGHSGAGPLLGLLAGM